MKATAADRQAQHHHQESADRPSIPPSAEAASDSEFDIHPIRLQPTFQPHPDDHYDVRNLLQFNDEQFVENSYQAILKRPADARGSKELLESLRSGHLNKIDILARLRFSPEGRAQGVAIDGLWFPATLRRLYRVPLVGYLSNLTVALVRLPSMISSHRQFEAHVMAQQELVVRQLNHIGATLTKHGQQTAQARAELLVQLHETHQTVLARVADLSTYVEERLNEEAADRQSHMRQLAQGLADMASQVLSLQRLQEEVRVEAGRTTQVFDERISSLQEKMFAAKSELQRLERKSGEADSALKKQAARFRADLEIYGQKVARLLEELTGRSEFSREKLEGLREEKAHLLDPLYASLAEPFRGDPDQIRERLKTYVPYLEGVGSDPLIDVGSGRGEWLKLAGELGFVATGIETNSMLVQQCRQQGLVIIERDLISYIASQPDNTIGAVTCFHVIEHLPFEAAVELLTEVMRVLKPGGVLMLETPNPRNVLVGACNFYFDPTHRNPIPAEVLQFLLESRGFSDIQLLLLNPSDEAPVSGDSDLATRFNQYFYGPMDYGIVARKPENKAQIDTDDT